MKGSVTGGQERWVERLGEPVRVDAGVQVQAGGKHASLPLMPYSHLGS